MKTPRSVVRALREQGLETLKSLYDKDVRELAEYILEKIREGEVKDAGDFNTLLGSAVLQSEWMSSDEAASMTLLASPSRMAAVEVMLDPLFKQMFGGANHVFIWKDLAGAAFQRDVRACLRANGAPAWVAEK